MKYEPDLYFVTFNETIEVHGPFPTMQECVEAGQEWQRDHNDDPRWNTISSPNVLFVTPKGLNS